MTPPGPRLDDRGAVHAVVAPDGARLWNFLDSVGLLLVSASPAMALLAAGFMGLMTTRARSGKRRRVADASPEYKRHYWRTGAFFPRFSGS